MTKAQALKEAQRRWGKDAAIRDGGSIQASTPALRQAASVELRTLRANKPKAPELFDTATWPDDRTIGDFRAARLAYIREIREWTTIESTLFSETQRKRFDVGRLSFAFHILGSGDSWEDAFKAAEGR